MKTFVCSAWLSLSFDIEIVCGGGEGTEVNPFYLHISSSWVNVRLLKVVSDLLKYIYIYIHGATDSRIRLLCYIA